MPFAVACVHVSVTRRHGVGESTSSVSWSCLEWPLFNIRRGRHIQILSSLPILLDNSRILLDVIFGDGLIALLHCSRNPQKFVALAVDAPPTKRGGRRIITA